MNKSTLLPPNATAEERAIEQTTARLGEIPAELGRLWNPDTCPAELLPWLAWALSVDEWDSEWSEQTQRGIIKASATVHRHKGTVGAVKKALASLGISVEFLEWFQDVDDLAIAPIHSTTPHTFIFIAWANENPYTSNEVFLNQNLYDAVQRVVWQTKPVRSHFDFLVGAKLNSDLVLGTASTGWLQVGRFCNETLPVQLPASKSDLAAAFVTSGHNLQVGRISTESAPVQVPAADSGLGAIFHLNQRRYSVARFYLI